MSDRKTAAELRMLLPVTWTQQTVDVLVAHCAAVEEEEEEARNTRDQAELREMYGVVADIRAALNAGPEESTVGAAKRVVQERDSAVARAEQTEGARACARASWALVRDERDAAIARADAAEKRVAELEALEARAGRIQDDATRAGIREGLERAAVWLEKNTWNTHAPSFVRALKEQVK